MNRSSALATASLVLGIGSLLAVAGGVSQARSAGDMMALGVFAMGLLVGAAIGVVGLILGALALRGGGLLRARAIVGMLLSALPVVVFAGLVISARLDRPPDLPLAPPSQPPRPPLAPPPVG